MNNGDIREQRLTRTRNTVIRRFRRFAEIQHNLQAAGANIRIMGRDEFMQQFDIQDEVPRPHVVDANPEGVPLDGRSDDEEDSSDTDEDNHSILSVEGNHHGQRAQEVHEDDNEDGQENDGNHVDHQHPHDADPQLSEPEEEHFNPNEGDDGDMMVEDLPVEEDSETDDEALAVNQARQGLRLDYEVRNFLQTTEKDFFVMHLAAAVRYRMSHEALLGMNRCFNAGHGMRYLPDTKYLLMTALGMKRYHMRRHVYCSACLTYIGVKDMRHHYECGFCHLRVHRNSAKYFITLSVKKQLQALMKHPGVSQLINYPNDRVKISENAAEDIYDGLLYERMKRNIGNRRFLTYAFNVDGFPVSSTSGLQAWPIIITVNELPPKKRSSYFILAGLWVDTVDPPMNVFLAPCVEEMNSLATDGVNLTLVGHEERVHFIFLPTVFIADAAARAPSLSLKKWNGHFGCTFCLVNGIRRDANGVDYTSKRYPVHLHADDRTDAGIREDMRLAVELGQAVRGVKGVSVIMNMIGFDLRNGQAVDRMHNRKGIVCDHFTLLMSSAEYFVGRVRQLDEVNRRLEDIRPPSGITRRPRSLNAAAFWTASEWRNLVLYYAVPCMEGIIQERYVRHFSLLSHAEYLIANQSVTPEDIVQAERLLESYLQEYERIFGAGAMSYNLHQLRHVMKCIRDWGPAWTHSTADYESIIAHLKRFITGHTHKVEQVVVRFCMEKMLQLVDTMPGLQQSTIDFVHTALGGSTRQSRVPGAAVIYEGVTLVGLGIDRLPSLEESQALNQKGFYFNRIVCYKKAIMRGQTYWSASYREQHETTKVCNRVVNCLDGEVGIITDIMQGPNHEVCGAFVQLFQQLGHLHHALHVVHSIRRNDLVFVPFLEIQRPAVMVKSTAILQYTIPLCNEVERD